MVFGELLLRPGDVAPEAVLKARWTIRPWAAFKLLKNCEAAAPLFSANPSKGSAEQLRSQPAMAVSADRPIQQHSYSATVQFTNKIKLLRGYNIS
jgi:hypothetical protein